MIVTKNNLKRPQNYTIYLMHLLKKIWISNYPHILYLGKKRLLDYLKKVTLFNKLMIIKIKTLYQ